MRMSQKKTKEKSAAVWVPIDDLVAWDRNPRQNDQAVDGVMRSIERFGFAAPVVARAEDRRIIAGHTRIKAARALGLAEVPVRFLNIDAGDADLLALADNKIAEIADWDEFGLAKIIQELEAAGEDFTGVGFDEDEVQRLIDLLGEPEEGLTDPDEVPDPPEEPITEPGDLWKLGEHRLFCGDSTNVLHLEAVMGGQLADLWLTDPPYNVDYVGKTKDALTIDNDNMQDADFRQFLRDVYSAADAVMKPGAAFYIWHADSNGYLFRGAAVDIDWEIRQCLIWVKSTLVMGRQDYHWKHEPCLYGWKSGAAHTWNSDRKQTTVLEFDKPHKNEDHPTMKPVDLFQYQLCNSTKTGAVVLDSFGGSGTTIIAAERTKRAARLVEIDPRYCDVIVQRWEAFTGRKAELIEPEQKQ